ncbi:MAG: VWA domain-containing protein [Gammaproteobacteria bacterium]|nr:VWA domain-containing protein [Gammaproteobacteria bacterium]
MAVESPRAVPLFEPLQPWPAGVRYEPMLERLVRFTRTLRDRGVAVSPARLVDLCQCFAHVDVGDRVDFYAAARATLVTRYEELAVFDHAFEEFWTLIDRVPHSEIAPEADEDEDDEGTERTQGEERSAAEQDTGSGADEEAPTPIGWSADEVLMRKNLASMSDAELERARRVLAELVALLATVRGRRYTSVPRGSKLDLRRMLRRNALRGADGIEFLYRRRKLKRLKLMLLCDVSGSMERYSRFLVEFIYALRRELPAVEVGVFATRMTVITDLLATRDVGKSLREVSATVRDWGGGTDIGGCLREFNDRFAREMLRTRTVMVILSDGWDRGDPVLLREEIEHLHRRVHKLIWLNPLLGAEGYEPLCRGIRTALPFMDYFLPAHSLESLAQLARTLRGLWR